MSSCQNECTKIAWVVPYINPGSGGLQTVFRHLTYLQERGVICHLLVMQKGNFLTDWEIRETLSRFYDCSPDKVYSIPYSDECYDITIATFNETLAYARLLRSKQCCYFVQDYEPWFYPMGESRLFAEETYRQGVPIITIGRWLSCKLADEYHACTWHTDFSVDQSIYYRKTAQRDRAICAVFQPEKPRRGSELLCNALEIVHYLEPDIELFTFGSEEKPAIDVPVIHLGMLTKEESNELYNRCQAGICISLSNPSRMPFEMMAAGLPVVDVYRENTLFDYPNSVVLSQPNAPSLATAAISLLEDGSYWSNISSSGVRFVADRTALSESETFLEILTNIMWGDRADVSKHDYNPSVHEAYVASSASLEAYRFLQKKRLRQSVKDAKPLPKNEYRKQYLNVHLKRPLRVETIEWARIYVWSDPFQADLMSYPLVVDGEDLISQIDFDDFGYTSGCYQIHAYAMLDGVDTKIGECEAIAHFNDSAVEDYDGVKEASSDAKPRLMPILLEQTDTPF